MGKEISYLVSSAMLTVLPSIPIVWTPIINTNTRELGRHGWTLTFRQNMVWGKPKIRLFDPATNRSIGIRLNTGGRQHTAVYLNPEALFATLSVAGSFTLTSEAHSFVNRMETQQLRDNVKKGEQLVTIQAERIRKLNADINLLTDQFQLLKNFSGTPNLQGIKEKLEAQVNNLQTEIASLKSRLHEIENEDSLETIQRLNRRSYENIQARPSMLREEDDRTDRIIETVRNLLDEIVRSTKIPVDKTLATNYLLTTTNQIK